MASQWEPGQKREKFKGKNCELSGAAAVAARALFLAGGDDLGASRHSRVNRTVSCSPGKGPSVRLKTAGKLCGFWTCPELSGLCRRPDFPAPSAQAWVQPSLPCPPPCLPAPLPVSPKQRAGQG